MYVFFVLSLAFVLFSCAGIGEASLGRSLSGQPSYAFKTEDKQGSTSRAFIPCGEWEMECVSVGPKGPYGTKEIRIPATQDWVNTGLYLKKGETAKISVIRARDWNPTGKGLTDKEGNVLRTSLSQSSCYAEQLIARIGLHYRDEKLHCINEYLKLTADKDGILYLGSMIEDDKALFYRDLRHHARGELGVKIESTGHTVPSIAWKNASTYDFQAVQSGWVEVYGEHIILTLPTTIAHKDKEKFEASLNRLDRVYNLHGRLRGAYPRFGQRIRFFPDKTIKDYDAPHMAAGNPIRVPDDYVISTAELLLSRAGEAQSNIWEATHQLGHLFAWYRGMGGYQVDSIEIWPNIFALHAFDELNLTPHPKVTCDTITGLDKYSDFIDNPFSALCFFKSFSDRYGWTFYRNFYTNINTREDEVGTTQWDYIYARFTAVAGEDVQTIFDTWSVPTISLLVLEEDFPERLTRCLIPY